MFEFITSMELVDLLVIGVFWLLSLLVGTVIVWKYVVPLFLPDIIVNMLLDPKPRTILAIQKLGILILTTNILTGKKIKNDNGKEIDEELPLLNYAGREIVGTILHKMHSAKGGAKNQINAQLEQAIAQGGGDVQSLLPVAINAALAGDYGLLVVILSQKLLNSPQKQSTPDMGGVKW